MEIQIHDTAGADDFEMGEADAERSVDQLKEKATTKKGRGFHDPRRLDRDGVGPGDRIDEDRAISGIHSQPQRSVEGYIIFINGLHEETSEESIMDAFAEFGQIKNLHLNQDRRTGFIKGYALVEFEGFKEAEDAITKMDGKDLLGVPVHVTWAFVKTPKKG